MFFQGENPIFKKSQINKIEAELSNLGLHLNMKNPITSEIDERADFNEEEIVDSNQEELKSETGKLDNQSLTTLMQKRIEEMQSKSTNLSLENERKSRLIEDCRQLIKQLEELTREGLELDRTMAELLGTKSKSAIGIEKKPKEVVLDKNEAKALLSDEISRKEKDNERKKTLIAEFKKVKEQLNNLQSEGNKLDAELLELLTPNSVKKRGEA